MKKAVNLLGPLTGLVLISLTASAERPEIRWLGGGHNAEVRGLAVSPDGQWIASGCNDQTVKLWRTADGKLVRTLLSELNAAVLSVAFSPDSQRIVAGCRTDYGGNATGFLELWQVSDGSMIWTQRVSWANPLVVDFASDGQRVAAACLDNNIYLLRATNGAIERTLTGHSSEVYGLAFAPNGQTLASGSRDQTIRFWSASDGGVLHTINPAHNGYIKWVDFSPDGTLLASAGYDNNVKLWRTSDYGLARTLTGHTNWVLNVAFSPDGSTLASGSLDKTAKLWRVSDGAPLRTLAGHTDWVYSLAFATNGLTLYSGGADRRIKQWEVNTGASLADLTGHNGLVRGAAFSPDGLWLASASDDQTAIVWHAADGMPQRRLVGHSNSVVAVAFSPDNGLLATAGQDKLIKLWNVTNGSLALNLTNHTATPYAVVFAPDSTNLGSLGSDGVRLWNVTDGQNYQTLSAGSGGSCLAWSPDGQFVAAGCFDKLIRVWRTSDFGIATTLVGHSNSVAALAFSADGQRLGSVSFESARIWQVADWSLERSLTETNSSLVFVTGDLSPNGQFMATTGSGGLRLWRVADGNVVSSYNEEIGRTINGIVFASDGLSYSYARSDGTVVVARTPGGGPLLSILQTTTNTVGVSWPSPSTGWELQQNTNSISSLNWSNVTSGVVDDGTTKTLIVTPPTGNRFYRLHKP